MINLKEKLAMAYFDLLILENRSKVEEDLTEASTEDSLNSVIGNSVKALGNVKNSLKNP